MARLVDSQNAVHLKDGLYVVRTRLGFDLALKDWWENYARGAMSMEFQEPEDRPQCFPAVVAFSLEYQGYHYPKAEWIYFNDLDREVKGVGRGTDDDIEALRVIQQRAKDVRGNDNLLAMTVLRAYWVGMGTMPLSEVLDFQSDSKPVGRSLRVVPPTTGHIEPNGDPNYVYRDQDDDDGGGD